MKPDRILTMNEPIEVIIYWLKNMVKNTMFKTCRADNNESKN